MSQKEELSFELYAAIYYAKQGWIIPEVHFKIFEFLEDESQWNDTKTKVLLLWRGIGKSTITDLWIAYKLTVNPALRFLILSADKETATKSSQDILSILRNHPLSKHLISSDRSVTKRKDQFFVCGSFDMRNPSVKAVGVTSNITGARADYIMYDDTEVPKNSGNESRRYELRKKISESRSLLTPEIGRRLLIGTYHDAVSIYDEEIGNGSASLRVPIISNTKGEFPYISGEPQWPERFDSEWVYQRQLDSLSKAEFFSQYLLIPSSIKDSILDQTRFIHYREEIEFKSANNRAYAKLGETTLYSVTCWWDVALSTARSDDSVVAVVFTDDNGHYYVHDIKKLVGDTDEQCQQVRKFALQYNIPSICVESNGIGALIPPILIKHMQGTGIGVDGVFNTQSQTKNTRIITAYETLLYGGRLHLHERVANSPFLNQIRDFDPSTVKNRDDYIDSVASCILREPIRIGALDGFGGKSMVSGWMGQGTYEMEMDRFQF
jgi:phage terminase large subunit-like protein